MERHYRRPQPNYNRYGVVVFLWFAVLMVYGWRSIPEYIHKHLMLAAAINVPLMLLFSAEGEMRNLSMLYVAIVVLIAGAMHRWLNSTSAPAGTHST